MDYNFILIGVGGYVAQRHVRAIKELGCNLVACSDINNSVGYLDSYFPNCNFFTSNEELINFVYRKYHNKIDYVSVCTPNYLHLSHCLIGLLLNADVICEKPLAITGKDISFLTLMESKFQRKVYNIVQLRYHPEVVKLQTKLDNSLHSVSLKYITPRGPWYYQTWKTDKLKSGGLLFNIGIHLFDLLIYLFGDVLEYSVEYSTLDTVSGSLVLENAEVEFLLSINSKLLPKDNKYPAYRSLMIDNEEFRFDNVFTDLHTLVYQNIISGNGYNIKQVSPAIRLVEKMSQGL